MLESTIAATELIDIYAKTLSQAPQTPDCIRIRFTGLPPAAKERLRRFIRRLHNRLNGQVRSYMGGLPEQFCYKKQQLWHDEGKGFHICQIFLPGIGMPRSTASALLLVDGYNVLGAWAELCQIRDPRKHDRQVIRYGLEESRRHLTEQLANYSALQGYQTQLVFDAQYRDTPANQEVITANLLIHYTDFGQTADTFIEKTCAALRHDVKYRRQRLIVATSDRAQQLTVVGYGAEWMSAEGLLADIDLVIQRVRRKQPAKRPVGRLLAHSLDPEAQKRLSDLRFGK